MFHADAIRSVQGDLKQEIGLLKKDVEETRAAQKRQIDGLRNNVKNELRDQITKTMKWVSLLHDWYIKSLMPLRLAGPKSRRVSGSPSKLKSRSRLLSGARPKTRRSSLKTSKAWPRRMTLSVVKPRSSSIIRKILTGHFRR